MKKFCLYLFIHILIANSIVGQSDDINILSILSPPGIANIYFKDSIHFGVASGWGGKLLGGNLIASARIPTSDTNLLLCQSDTTDFSGHIAVIRRGTCEFSLKALNAQLQGAIAVIIVNFENAVITAMGAGASGSQVRIPAIFVTKDIGEPIIQAIQNGQNVILEMKSDLTEYGLLLGSTYLDQNGNCLADTLDSILPKAQIRITDKAGSNYFVKSDANGNYFKYLNAQLSPFKITVNTGRAGWSSCPETELSLNVGDSIREDFITQKIKDCVELHTEISASRLRPCRPVYFEVNVCNQGTVSGQQCYVDIKLDPAFRAISYHSLPYSIVDTNSYRFQLGKLNIGDCDLLRFESELKCDTIIIGRTLCYEAQAFPDTHCKEINSLWGGANIMLTGKCTGNEVEFLLVNSGTGDMREDGNFKIVENNKLLQTSTYFLRSGETKKFALPANGSTWHFEATQEIHHPFPSALVKNIEACSTNGIFDKGFAMMFPLAEGTFSHDEECQEVRSSYDPNDKTAYPSGFGSSNLIEPDTELEYKIQFQNTGNDTAYKVVVIDDLPEALDPESIHSVSSSHEFEMSIIGTRTLRFIFDNIYLVDSFTNELMSHGFVTFKIRQKPGIPLGTVINNKAIIYFDINAGVVTNVCHHEVGKIDLSTQSKEFSTQATLSVYPNPARPEQILYLNTKDLFIASWKLIDINGKMVAEGDVAKNRVELPMSIKLSGWYLLELKDQNGFRFALKLALLN